MGEVGLIVARGCCTKAAADDGVYRIAAAGRRAVEAADVGPIAGLGKMLRHQAQMAGIVQ